MKIISAIKIFSRLVKIAFISSKEVSAAIQQNRKLIISKKGEDFFSTFETLFNNAFSLHDKLYEDISNMMNNKVVIYFTKGDFGKSAERAHKAAKKLKEFLLTNMDFSEIEIAQIDGRFELVTRGFENAIRLYMQYTMRNERLPKSAEHMVSHEFHSILHGFLEYMLFKSLDSFEK